VNDDGYDREDKQQVNQKSADMEQSEATNPTKY
jgi:hypothetical protein